MSRGLGRCPSQPIPPAEWLWLAPSDTLAP